MAGGDLGTLSEVGGDQSTTYNSQNYCLQRKRKAEGVKKTYFGGGKKPY